MKTCLTLIKHITPFYIQKIKKDKCINIENQYNIWVKFLILKKGEV